MRTFYLVLVPLSFVGLASLYYLDGRLAAGIGLTLWILGFVQHKHRAYVRSLKDRAVGEYENALNRWFGA